MLWKFEGSRPVYLQIMEQLRRAVLVGEYPPGGRIPPVRELAMAAKVNPNTMQRALVALEQEGLLYSANTVGRFVTSDQQVLEKMRTAVVAATVRDCAKQFRALDIPLKEAAQLLLELEQEA